jgi:CO/xanthine dehydrogenase FAD-binding subunit
MSLPAGSMISLTASLEGICTLWPRDSEPRKVAVTDFVTGNHTNVLQRGELLRFIHLPARALAKRFAFRRASLTHWGRSAIIVIGTQNSGSNDLLLTVTAATVRPHQLRFDRMPDAQTLREAIFASIPEADYFEDVHGSALYKRHLTYYFAEQIRAEFFNGGQT